MLNTWPLLEGNTTSSFRAAQCASLYCAALQKGKVVTYTANFYLIYGKTFCNYKYVDISLHISGGLVGFQLQITWLEA